MRTIRAALGVAMLVAVGTGCSSATDDIATSGPETGTILVHGIVKKDGKPLSGTQIGLTLMPEGDHMDDVRADGSIDTYDPKPVITGADGAFALPLDPEELSSKYYNGDFLNFEMMAFHDRSMGSWNSTVYLIDERVWRSDEQARVADPLLRMDFDFGKQTVVVTDSLGEKETSEWTVVQ